VFLSRIVIACCCFVITTNLLWVNDPHAFAFDCLSVQSMRDCQFNVSQHCWQMSYWRYKVMACVCPSAPEESSLRGRSFRELEQRSCIWSMSLGTIATRHSKGPRHHEGPPIRRCHLRITERQPYNPEPKSDPWYVYNSSEWRLFRATGQYPRYSWLSAARCRTTVIADTFCLPRRISGGVWTLYLYSLRPVTRSVDYG
jgi:hypothetical protein